MEPALFDAAPGSTGAYSGHVWSAPESRHRYKMFTHRPTIAVPALGSNLKKKSAPKKPSNGGSGSETLVLKA